MSELEEVLSIEGAIDRAVVEKETLLPIVADMLVPYRDGAAGWFVEFEGWVRERTGVGPDDDVFPSLEDALGRMAGMEPVGRDRAQRLLALTVLSRVVEGYSPQGDFGPDVQAALVALTPDQSSDEAAALHELVFDADRRFATIEQWAEMLSAGEQLGVLDATTARQTVPPCAATWRSVQVGGTAVAATKLTAHEVFPGLTIADVEHFLDPQQWPSCHPFWCSMEPVNPPVPGHRLYTEVVSLACGLGPKMSFTTVLEFVTVRTPATATTPARVDMQYWLWPPPNPPQGDGEILVDEGFISAWESSAGLHLHTVKLVAFAPPFPSAYLAMIMCPLGYAAQGEHMVYTCALPAAGGEAGEAGGHLEVDEPVGPGLLQRLRRRRAEPTTTVYLSPERGGLATATSAQASTAAPDGNAVNVAKVMADALCGCGQDASSAYASSVQKVQDGTYTSADAMADGLSWWARLVRDAGLVASAARAAGRRRAPGPPPTPDPDRGGNP